MYEYKVIKILSVYDGDTITALIDLGFGVHKKEKFRLGLIDAPELRGEERKEREDGLVSRDYLRKIIQTAEETETEIIIKTTKDRKGKYGRYIGVIYIQGVNINIHMINEGYALPYE
jgi:micrococcal nuclease